MIVSAVLMSPLPVKLDKMGQRSIFDAIFMKKEKYYKNSLKKYNVNIC